MARLRRSMSTSQTILAQAFTMMVVRVTATVPASSPSISLYVGECSDPTASGFQWNNTTHQITREATSPTTPVSTVTSTTTLCITATGYSAGAPLLLQPCISTTPMTQWLPTYGTVAAAAAGKTQFGWVSEGGSQAPGEEVWLYDVVAKKGYCAAHKSCTFTFDSSLGVFKNPAGNCVVAKAVSPPPPPAPPGPKPSGKDLNFTCAPGSVESSLPFCNTSLGFDARAEDLVNRLNQTEQVGFFFSYPGTPYIKRYNLKTWSLDSTCIHGVASRRAGHVTVFPHAIAQGASWDVDLVRRLSSVTATEARIVSAQTYYNSGENQGSVLSCDGGPLANSAHDPRWGRISETYGEDPMLIQTIGVTAMNGLQGPLPVPGGRAEDIFFATRQVTRHYIAYHGASPDIGPPSCHEFGSCNFISTNRSLSDSYFPTYGAFQDPTKGRADGIMCAMSRLNGVPSCADPLLLNTMLRQTWKSDSIVQSDCCDSIQTMVKAISPDTGRAITNLTEAFGTAVNAGLGTYYGYYVGPFRDAMFDLLGPAVNGNGQHISATTLKAAAKRMLISHMRLGFYDTHRADYPYKYLFNTSSWGALDSADHRTVAREAAAASIVLLKNNNHTLPLATTSPATKTAASSSSSSSSSSSLSSSSSSSSSVSLSSSSIALIGPFAACSSTDTAPANLTASEGQCYLHSYNGQPSSISSLYGGIAVAAATTGTTVTYAQGSNETCDKGGGAIGEVDCAVNPSSKFYKPAAAALIKAAVATAAAAGVTVLCVGLGASMEAEGRDRVNMTLPSVQRALLSAVAEVANKLIIVVVSAGGVDLNESVADAVLWAPYGGEEAGSGLADILWGKTVPSARLPLSFYTQAWADDMNCKNFTEVPGGARKENADCNTSILHLDLEAGVGRTHRYISDSAKYIKHNFGYGLSYTTFKYHSVTVFNQIATVILANTGAVTADEIVQVYAAGATVAGLPTPHQNLIGFVKVTVLPGYTIPVKIPIDMTQMATALANGTTQLLHGSYTVWAGGHLNNDAEGTAGTSGATVSTTLQL